MTPLKTSANLISLAFSAGKIRSFKRIAERVWQTSNSLVWFEICECFGSECGIAQVSYQASLSTEAIIFSLCTRPLCAHSMPGLCPCLSHSWELSMSFQSFFEATSSLFCLSWKFEAATTDISFRANTNDSKMNMPNSTTPISYLPFARPHLSRRNKLLLCCSVFSISKVEA